MNKIRLLNLKGVDLFLRIAPTIVRNFKVDDNTNKTQIVWGKENVIDFQRKRCPFLSNDREGTLSMTVKIVRKENNS